MRVVFYGGAYQYLVGDETKYLEKIRIDRLFSALRGFGI